MKTHADLCRAFQSFFWHSLEQYKTFLQTAQRCLPGWLHPALLQADCDISACHTPHRATSQFVEAAPVLFLIFDMHQKRSIFFWWEFLFFFPLIGFGCPTRTHGREFLKQNW